ncbi:response regulator transcription factor [Acidaminobacter sp. JC074]|uniref:response regulator transcription factor n=1 Tax=Acidaminobacter sp. JC074 TaxID=2530199 RepID=UPI001F10BBE3|nr:response regulator transcription factor [Acidaminobacter sp. JC074]MCH4891412.1 response regulator transcription factor [Acidaminobacter sp. JC074]
MRILLAEDEKDLSKALVSALEKNKYSVDAVYNGEDAVDYILLGNYDAAIFDIMMPIKSGLEALRELRSKKIDIPILLLTAKVEISDRVEGLDYGADDYLTKPFAIEELMARIRTMTRRKIHGRTENVIVMNQTKLDLLNHEIITQAGKTFLGNKEFQMFEMFMSNQNQYITVDMLFEKIWGLEHDADVSVVWVNISNLRKKLRKLHSNLTIEAKRNIGYRLVEKDD